MHETVRAGRVVYSVTGSYYGNSYYGNGVADVKDVATPAAGLLLKWLTIRRYLSKTRATQPGHGINYLPFLCFFAKSISHKAICKNYILLMLYMDEKNCLSENSQHVK